MDNAPMLAIVLALVIVLPPSGAAAGPGQLIHNPDGRGNGNSRV